MKKKTYSTTAKYLLNSCAAKVLRDGDGGADDPLEAQLVDVESRTVAVHEHHGGGKVEEARGQDAQTGPRVEGLARVQSVIVEVEAARQDQRSEKRQRRHPSQTDDGHATLRRDQWPQMHIKFQSFHAQKGHIGTRYFDQHILLNEDLIKIYLVKLIQISYTYNLLL